jgi:hypothetical protein
MSEDAIALASTKADIAAPLADVRGQFFDVQAHVSGGLYHDVELSFAPDHPVASRRLRQATRVLGRLQVEDFVVEEGAAGEWTRRYVDGPNAGARFVASFRAQSATSTNVQLEAFVPRAGFTAGIAKVSRLGMERILEKTLADHQRVIERKVASGQPLSALAAPPVTDEALASMRTLGTCLRELAPEARTEAIQTLLEIACIVAIADGHVDELERAAVHRVFRELCGIELGAEAMDELLASAAEIVASDGVEVRCALAGCALQALDLVDLGLDVGATVAIVSHGIDRHELCALGAIAAASGVGELEVDRAVARAGRGGRSA